MKSTDAPSKQAVPFGSNGPREAITATTPSGSNQASYDQGFPPITMTLKSAGGLPPKGQDMNQILFEQSSFNRYFASGGSYVYDSAFSTAVGGYPLSARIPNSTGTGFWFNTMEDNQNNPENSTSALTGWVPMGSYGVTAINGLASASVTLTTLQASKERITLTGALTANINIVVPAWIKRWEVINNCTGAFTVTIKTPSGTGVAIASGTNMSVMGDGVNVVAYYSPGSLIGPPIVITNTGTYTPSAGTKKVLVELVGGGGGGGYGSSSNYGSGGGAGAVAKKFLPISGSVSVTVGFAGNGGTVSAQATPGGASVFGSVSAGGGAAGAFNSPTAGVGGTASGGDVNIQGGTGSGGLNAGGTVIAGAGGASPGYSNSSGYVAASPSPSTGYGSGGGGGANGNSGGAGRPGIVIIWEYA